LDKRSWRSQKPHPITSSACSACWKSLGTAGNLVTDAQIAAVAIEHDAVVHTADADFIRFKGLRWLNPITG
jgi:predicted nucleic acid-binding protein